MKKRLLCKRKKTEDMRLVCRIYNALPGTIAETAASDSAR